MKEISVSDYVQTSKYIDYEAEKFNIPPYVLAYFPPESNDEQEKGFVIDNKNIILTTVQKRENGVIFRLFNSSDNEETAIVEIGNAKTEIELDKFEVKTFLFDNEKISETHMLEKE